METAIDVEKLAKKYGTTVAAADVSFSVEPGEVVGLLGRNGAGKTTTVECIAGLRRPDGGRVRVLGLDPVRDRARLRPVVGVQLQQVMLHEALTVRELVRLFASFYPDPDPADEIIERVGLSEQSSTRFNNLSGGQQQRLSIALALVGRPHVAILDELTTGLDPAARRMVWAVVEDLQRDGVGVLLVSHAMEEVERLCRNLVLLHNGEVIATGSPDDVVAASGLRPAVVYRATGDDGADALRGITGVETVSRRDDGAVTVTGDEGIADLVARALRDLDVIVTESRHERPTLDDAFLALTGSAPDAEDTMVAADARGGQQ